MSILGRELRHLMRYNEMKSNIIYSIKHKKSDVNLPIFKIINEKTEILEILKYELEKGYGKNYKCPSCGHGSLEIDDFVFCHSEGCRLNKRCDSFELWCVIHGRDKGFKSLCLFCEEFGIEVPERKSFEFVDIKGFLDLHYEKCVYMLKYLCSFGDMTQRDLSEFVDFGKTDYVSHYINDSKKMSDKMKYKFTKKILENRNLNKKFKELKEKYKKFYD